jgi:aldehyde:ferredoxin oxidoreductase
VEVTESAVGRWRVGDECEVEMVIVHWARHLHLDQQGQCSWCGTSLVRETLRSLAAAATGSLCRPGQSWCWGCRIRRLKRKGRQGDATLMQKNR